MQTLSRLLATRTFWSAIITLIISVARIWGADSQVLETLNLVGAFLTAAFLRDAVAKQDTAAPSTEGQP